MNARQVLMKGAVVKIVGHGLWHAFRLNGRS
jgi:hypothetical protein